MSTLPGGPKPVPYRATLAQRPPSEGSTPYPDASFPAHPGLSRLRQILESRHRELKAYATRPDARQGHVDKENAHLESLQTALSELLPLVDRDSPPLRHAQTWALAEEALLGLLRADPQLAGVRFSLRLRPQGHHFAIVQL